MTTTAASMSSSRRAAESMPWRTKTRQPLFSDFSSDTAVGGVFDVAEFFARHTVKAPEVLRSLPRGGVVALGARHAGQNGRFETGDVGTAFFVCDTEDFVEIVWPNRTRTKTAWPNQSWYAGRPFRVSEAVSERREHGIECQARGCPRLSVRSSDVSSASSATASARSSRAGLTPEDMPHAGIHGARPGVPSMIST